jgi:hypothetical protein
MTKTLIAKPVVKDQYWIVTDGEGKVGNVLAEGSGYEVKLNGNKSFFKSTKTIQKQVNIEFQPVQPQPKFKEIPFKDYPTTKKVHNSMLDIKRKLHLFTKTPKSKCYHAAGWFNVVTEGKKKAIFCPKYIIIQRYQFTGPYKSKEEAQSMLLNT